MISESRFLLQADTLLWGFGVIFIVIIITVLMLDLPFLGHI